MYILAKLFMKFLIMRIFDFFILTKILNQTMICLYIWVTLYCPMSIYSPYMFYCLIFIISVNIIFTLENIQNTKNKVYDMLKN